MTQRPEWPVAFFDEDYLTIYRPMFSDEATGKEADFIESVLGLEKGVRVLDLACGFGRHANALGRRGYTVTGLDFNANYLAIGEAVAREGGLPVSWVRGDMRSLSFDAEFDAAYSFFTSFGYFSDEENEQVIAGVVRSLKPGGRFLLDVANRDWIVTHPAHRIWNRRDNGALLMEEVTLDLKTSRVTSRMMHIGPDAGPRVEKEFELRVYTCGELRSLFARHGLETRDVWGGADRSEYSTESRRLVMLAVKSPASETGRRRGPSRTGGP